MGEARGLPQYVLHAYDDVLAACISVPGAVPEAVRKSPRRCFLSDDYETRLRVRQCRDAAAAIDGLYGGVIKFKAGKPTGLPVGGTAVL